MSAQWTGDVVGKMHLNRISQKELADKLSVTRDYVCMVLNGRRTPSGAQERFCKALEELIKEKENPPS